MRAISDTLGAKLGGGVSPSKRPAGTGTANPAAYDLYLRGEYLLQRRGPGVERSIESFERAILADPAFARAHAGLSAALALIPYYNGTPPTDVFDRSTSSARRALELDSTLAEAHSSLAIAYWTTSRPDVAEREFHRAIAVDPNDQGAHFHYGRLLIDLGRPREALLQLELAKRNDPVSPLISSWSAHCLAVSGRLPAGLAEITTALQIDSTILPTVNFGGMLNLMAGRKAEARRITMLLPPSRSMTYAPFIFAATGDTTAAMGIVRNMEARRPRPWFADVERASVMLAVGDTALALDALERSTARSHGAWTIFLPLMDPMYDGVRRSARFAALLRRTKMDGNFFELPDGGRGRGR